MRVEVREPGCRRGRANSGRLGTMQNMSPAGNAPTLSSGHWHDLCTSDFERVDAERCIALLPVAATEQHGAHLPLATDALINQGVVSETLRRLPPSASVLVLPALNIGDSLEHSTFPGTLSAGLDALLALWLAVGDGVARAGVRKLVIFNSHGGQRAHVDLAALRLRVAHGLMVVRAHSFAFGAPPGLFDATELAHGLHGGAAETSLILHLRPDLVRHEAIANFATPGPALAARGGWLGVEKPIGLGWMAQDLNPHGVCGDARAASAHKGRLLLEHMAQGLCQLLAEVEATAWPPPAPQG
jgi:creatinine amidohydrolase